MAASSSYRVMACMVMAHIVMAYTDMARVVTAFAGLRHQGYI